MPLPDEPATGSVSEEQDGKSGELGGGGLGGGVLGGGGLGGGGGRGGVAMAVLAEEAWAA